MLVGPATRLARYVAGDRKCYRATAELGVTTDTDDATGAVTGGIGRAVSEQDVAGALASMVGTLHQVPPAYSARHVNGERSYRRARRGETVVLPARECTVYSMELIRAAGPVVEFECVVSAGTYIRALARDLGAQLGTGAHLQALRRLAIGPFRVDDAVPLATLDAAIPLRPVLELLADLPTQALDQTEFDAVLHGRPVAQQAPGGTIALLSEGEVVAIAEGAGGWLRPRVVLTGT